MVVFYAKSEGDHPSPSMYSAKLQFILYVTLGFQFILEPFIGPVYKGA